MVSTNSESRLRPWLFSALAMAEASSLATGSAAACGENCRIEAAAATSVPRIRVTMRRAFIGVIRKCLSWALVRGTSTATSAFLAFMKYSCPYSAAPSATVVLDVALEGPRRSELAELVTDHRLGDEHRDVLAAVVHGDRVPQHVGDDRRAARPGLDDGLGAFVVGDVHLLEQVVIDERALFETAWHLLSSCSVLGGLGGIAGLHGHQRFLPPLRRRRTISLSLALFGRRVRPSGLPPGLTG